MKKSDRKSILENLDKALDPPGGRRKPALAAGLADYDDEPQAVHPVPLPSGGLTPLHGQTPTPPQTAPIAPARDFNKRANSIERDAMPSGMFPGTSKKLYDALYLRTRGAVKPSRMIRATKKDLAVWSGIKNRKTIDAHLRYFDMVGLVRREWIPGQNEGYKFEVVLPEEIGLGDRPPLVVRPLQESDRKLVRGSDQKMGSGGQTQTIEEQDTSGEPQTIFKTVGKNPDDERARSIGQIFMEMEREVTGANKSTLDQWAKLKGVLLGELKSVATRSTVNSASAILAEHLTRRFSKPDTPRKEGKRATTTEPLPLAPEEIAPPAPDEVAEFERARAELEGKGKD
jgi:hypothetical protein